MVNYWQALGYLKNKGFVNFETYKGETKTYDELRTRPIVSYPKKSYRPTTSGELRTLDGFVLLKAIK